jgi:2-oxoglutarate ferredoxin oxidoreductase subunit delta
MAQSKKAANGNNSRQTKNSISENKNPNGKPQRLYNQMIFRDWCKACGICIAFCPKHVFEKDTAGKPVINNPDDCIGCRFCELHCPDFAITIKERLIDRRKKRDAE